MLSREQCIVRKEVKDECSSSVMFGGIVQHLKSHSGTLSVDPVATAHDDATGV